MKAPFKMDLKSELAKIVKYAKAQVDVAKCGRCRDKWEHVLILAFNALEGPSREEIDRMIKE